MVPLRTVLVALLTAAACVPTKHKPNTKTVAMDGGTGGTNAMTLTPCEAARRAIESNSFSAWTGLPPACTTEALFGISFDDQWGLQKLGATFEPARTHLLEISGYYRPMAYVRDGRPLMFDGMPTTVDGSWPPLASALGTAEAINDWIFGTVTIPKGEHIYARRGITVWMEPDKQQVIYVAVYAPTTVDEYVKRLRPSREKRMK